MLEPKTEGGLGRLELAVSLDLVTEDLEALSPDEDQQPDLMAEISQAGD